MEKYNRTFIQHLAEKIELEGKVILEIGCGNGDDLKYIAETYKPKQIIGIDKMLDSYWATKPSIGEGWEVKVGDAMNMDFPENYFDVIFSLATFEHISDVNATLSEIKRVLKPFGKFYTEFAPIWTSIIGHHYNYWINEDQAKVIPPWGHLWMDEFEMFDYLVEKIGKEEAQKACYQIYQNKALNRIPRNQFYDTIRDSGLWVRHFQESISFSRTAHFGDSNSEMTDEIIMKLKGKYTPQEVAVSGLAIFLEKIASIT